jgi:ADP-ribose pyrophosphatase
MKSMIVYNGFLKIHKLSLDIGDREVCVRPDAVALLLYDNMNVLLTKQQRVGGLWNNDGELLEVPAGMVDPGEAPEDAVKREILEEIGVNITNMMYHNYFYPSSGGSSERIHLFSAKVSDLSKFEFTPQNDDHEKIEIVILPKNKVNTLDMKTALLLKLIEDSQANE